ATAYGGGVAEILQNLVPLLRDAGVDAHWAVLDAPPAFYDITKKIHNALQGMKLDLSESEKELFLDVARENAAQLMDADVVLAHDPQAVALRHFAKDPDRAGWVSRFDPWKDPLGVIDAYRLVKKEVRDVQLVMIGSLADDDPEGQEYFDRTKKHAGDDKDVFLFTNLDGVKDREVNAFQRASEVVIQKSLREGFGLVVAEGLWKGIPVVAGKVGGIVIQIQDGISGYLVTSPEECAARSLDLLRDPALRKRMAAAGREHVRQNFLITRDLR